MKLKTMLRFLLCFLIIGSINSFTQVNAHTTESMKCKSGCTWKTVYNTRLDGSTYTRDDSKHDILTYCQVCFYELNYLENVSCQREEAYTYVANGKHDHHTVCKYCGSKQYLFGVVDCNLTNKAYEVPFGDFYHILTGYCTLCKTDVKIEQACYIGKTEKPVINGNLTHNLMKVCDCGRDSASIYRIDCDMNGAGKWITASNSKLSEYHYFLPTCSKCGQDWKSRIKEENTGISIYDKNGKWIDFLEEGKHTASASYSWAWIGNDMHCQNRTCSVCNVTYQGGNEKHSFVNGKCICGATKGMTAKEVTINGPTASGFFGAAGGNIDYSVVDGQLDFVYHIQSIIMLVGCIAAAAVTGIYAIQWLTATPARRQELKASLFPLGIGIALLILGPTFAVMIVNILLEM